MGEPWAYVLRDVLRYATTAEEAVAVMAAAKRTCPIYVGIGAQPAGGDAGVCVVPAPPVRVAVSWWSAAMLCCHPCGT